MTLDVHTVRRYLLGDLPEQECEALEARYFGDAEALDELQSLEESLIEDYIDGRLSADDRGRMERNYLSHPAHRTRVAVSRQLRRASGHSHRFSERRVSRAPSRRGPLPLIALAASVLVVVVATRYAFLRSTEPIAPIGPTSVTTTASTGAERAAPAAGERPRAAEAPARPVLALALPALALRSGGALPTVRRSAQPSDLELVFELGDGPAHGPFAVTVRTVEDVTTWTGRTEGSEGGDPTSVRVRIPLEALPADDYLVSLVPEQGPRNVPARRYAFRVRDDAAGASAK